MSRPTAPEALKSTRDLPKVVRAKGAYLWDASGKQYIDGSGGPAVYCLGHANAEVNRAICDQLEALAHGYRYNFTTDALEEITEIVQARCGGTLREMVFVTGGSEAVESCLKIALAVSDGHRAEVASGVHQPGTQLAREYAGGAGYFGFCRKNSGL